MLAFDFLCAAFADGVLFRVKVTCVRTSLIGVVVGQAEGIQQRFELEEYLIFPAAKDIRSHLPRLMIDGMSEPTRVVFAAAKRPHFIHLGLASTLDAHSYPVCIQRTQQRRVDRLQHRFFLLESTEYGVGTDM
jgi:hypothetical protein